MFDAATFIAGLPHLPGVYRMLTAGGDVLYVGKARDLKKRVASYFQKSDHGPRTQVMLTQVAAVEVTVTRSEGEALLLEGNLIKSLAPRYNIVFRDDKSYPYLMITGHAFPRLGFHRGALDRQHTYYGPFPNAGAVRESIQLLQKVFRLRTCEDSVFENRSRPCLLHQIERCSAPCVGRIEPPLYDADVQNARLFMEGREDDVMTALAARMQTAADVRDYERAAVYRDQIRALAKVQTRQYVDTTKALDADVVACAIDQGIACVNLVMIRNGRYLGDKSFFPQHAEERTAGDVIAAFLAQHYPQRPPPGLIVASEDVDAEELAARAQRARWPSGPDRDAAAGRAARLARDGRAQRYPGARAPGARAGHPGGTARRDARGPRTTALGPADRVLRYQPHPGRADRRRVCRVRPVSPAQFGVPPLQHRRDPAGRRLCGDAGCAAPSLRRRSRGERGWSPT